MSTNGTTAGKILVLPGDHIGPEVVAEALKVLDIIEAHKGIKFEREFDLCGGCSLDKHGIASTEEALQKSVEADAVFFGSAGGPEWGHSQPNPESGLLRVRQKMQVSFSLRWVKHVVLVAYLFSRSLPICDLATSLRSRWWRGRRSKRS